MVGQFTALRPSVLHLKHRDDRSTALLQFRTRCPISWNLKQRVTVSRKRTRQLTHPTLTLRVFISFFVAATGNRILAA